MVKAINQRQCSIPLYKPLTRPRNSQSVLRKLTYLLGNHPELFKVYHFIYTTVVAQVDKCQVFLDNWPKWNYRWLDILRIDKVPVTRHVAAGVHQLLHLVEQSQIFGGQFFPSWFESGDSSVSKTWNRDENRIFGFLIAWPKTKLLHIWGFSWHLQDFFLNRFFKNL